MSLGLVGIKQGMTRIFAEDGTLIPVTLIEVAPNRVTQIKTLDTDGYDAVQITTGSKKAKHLNKAEAGHFAKAGVDAGQGLWEFCLNTAASSGESENSIKIGDEYKVDLFSTGNFVDITGITIGKGFAGVVKRHHFRTQDATHGNSLSHRAPGSIGQNQSPGRVFKGKKMSGHLGNKKRTIQNLEVIKVDVERNLLLVKGAVPGANGGKLVIRTAVKKTTKN